jgi:hypothetical protein
VEGKWMERKGEGKISRWGCKKEKEEGNEGLLFLKSDGEGQRLTVCSIDRLVDAIYTLPHK